MTKRWHVGVVAAALTITSLSPGVAEAGESSTAGAGQPASAKTGKHKVWCEYIPTPDNPAAKPVRPPRPKAKSRGTVRLTLRTNHGDIVMKLDRGNAPCAVHSMVSLTRQRFYNRTQCWRLTDSERLGVLQCGDIYAAEEGGPGYEFADELTGDETYPRGTVALGNWGPDTNGSQFFMVHSHADIPPAYTILGRVIKGMDVLDAIVAGGIIPDDDGDPEDGLPAKPVKIHRAIARG